MNESHEGRRGFPAMTNRVVEELQQREDQAHKGIRALKIAWSNQKSDLLAFAEVLDQKLAGIAHRFQISLSQVREVCLLMKNSLSTNVYWQKWNQVYQLLSEKFLPVKEAVESAMKSTPRASSLVENLNSRSLKLLFSQKASEFWWSRSSSVFLESSHLQWKPS